VPENRLTSVSDGGTFVYDPTGQRTKKVENGITTYYFFGCYEEEWQNDAVIKATKYYFANGMRIAERSITDGLRYYHADHLGSSTAITNADGSQVLLSTGYTPYGSSAYSTGSATIKYQYTGQEKDACGLMYYNARYYDPELGRFIQPDTMLDGLNRYTYCGGNPIVYSDPSGHVVEWWVYAIIYVCVAYFSGAQSSGSWNPADWSANDWWMAATWGTGQIGGGWSSQNGPYVAVGDIQYSPGETTRQQDTEQKIAQTQDNFMASLVEYNTIMAEYYDFWNTLLNAGAPTPSPIPDPNILDIMPPPTPGPKLNSFLDDGEHWFCGLMGYNVAVSRGTYLGYKSGVKLLDTPKPGTAGFIYFYAGKLDLKVEHVQYFEYFGGKTYTTWQTTGRGGDFPLNARNQLPHPREVNIDNSNLQMWGYDHVNYYTIGPAPVINFLNLNIPYPSIFYVYPVDHRWKMK
jgi:RHS repeat-associated protein